MICIYNSNKKFDQLKTDRVKPGLHFTMFFLPYVLCVEFSDMRFTDVLKQGKVEALLVKKQDLEATLEDLQKREKETKNVLQIREV